MTARIENIIPQQNFEKVRDRIGLIAFEELTNQKVLQGSDFPEAVNVFTERITPADIEEQIIVNILFDSAQYGSFTEKDSQGRTIYFIDVYTTGVETTTKTGSQDSSFRLHKFVGMLRYIFSSTLYNTLGFDPGFIGGKYLENITTLNPSEKEDSVFTRFARLQLAVRIQEDQEMWDGVAFELNDTTVKLSLTDKGYKYIL